MVVHPNCPKCGGRGEIFASMYYCPNCRIRYRKDGIVVWENGKYIDLTKTTEEYRARQRAETLKKLSNLEKAGRFEEAACLYESMEMYEEAGRVRAKDRQIGIVRTEVSVDLNKLLEQVREDGIVAVYRCPHCGGKLKIRARK